MADQTRKGLSEFEQIKQAEADARNEVLNQVKADVSYAQVLKRKTHNAWVRGTKFKNKQVSSVQGEEASERQVSSEQGEKARWADWDVTESGVMVDKNSIADSKDGKISIVTVLSAEQDAEEKAIKEKERAQKYDELFEGVEKLLVHEIENEGDLDSEELAVQIRQKQEKLFALFQQVSMQSKKERKDSIPGEDDDTRKDHRKESGKEKPKRAKSVPSDNPDSSSSSESEGSSTSDAESNYSIKSETHKAEETDDSKGSDVPNSSESSSDSESNSDSSSPSKKARRAGVKKPPSNPSTPTSSKKKMNKKKKKSKKLKKAKKKSKGVMTTVKAPNVPLLSGSNDLDWIQLEKDYRQYQNECEKAYLNPKRIEYCLVDTKVSKLRTDFRVGTLKHEVTDRDKIRTKEILKRIDQAKARYPEARESMVMKGLKAHLKKENAYDLNIDNIPSRTARFRSEISIYLNQHNIKFKEPKDKAERYKRKQFRKDLTYIMLDQIKPTALKEQIKTKFRNNYSSREQTPELILELILKYAVPFLEVEKLEKAVNKTPEKKKESTPANKPKTSFARRANALHVIEHSNAICSYCGLKHWFLRRTKQNPNKLVLNCPKEIPEDKYQELRKAEEKIMKEKLKKNEKFKEQMEKRRKGNSARFNDLEKTVESLRAKLAKGGKKSKKARKARRSEPEPESDDSDSSDTSESD